MVAVLIGLLILGVVMYLINAYVPMPSPIKAVLNAVVAIVALLWSLQALGLFGGLRLH